MRIVCVKWGDKYGNDYVYKLKAACDRHIPHTGFVCFTDKPVRGIACLPLPSNLPTWWAKIGLFKPGLLRGNMLYLDLDVVLTGSLWKFISAFYREPDKLWALDDFSYTLKDYCKDGQPAPVSDEVLGWLGGPGASTLNSSVMLWRNDVARAVWDDFTPKVMDKYHGDQNWITRTLWPNFRLLPEGVALSYKYGQHKQAPVVIFHGDPKPADVRDSWVLENWAA